MLTEKRALRRLRLQLTLVYLAAALGFIVLAGGLSFVLLRHYFHSAVDSALRNRVALELIQLGLPLPPDLERARFEWLSLRNLPISDDKLREPEEPDKGRQEDRRRRDEEEESGDDSSETVIRVQIEQPSDVFLLRLSADGRLLATPPLLPAGFLPSVEAVQAAGRAGVDWRTVETSAGEPIRLLTYALHNGQIDLYVQAGRSVLEQEIVFRQFMTGVLAGGGVLAALAALASWSIAGRSLKPVQAAWERQREFVANASHELRAPLSLIQLSAELATRADTPPAEQRDLAADVLREARHMAHLIDDLLLLSRADVGRLPVHLEPVPVQRVLDGLSAEWTRACAARGIMLDVASTPCIARADETYLRQVLLALLDNAVRYTPAGGQITIRVSPRDRWIDVVVRDTGPGIPAEHLPHLFERFYQADPARTDKAHAGLGLSIVRTLVEAMGGSVDLDSRLGYGVTVTVSLPKA